MADLFKEIIPSILTTKKNALENEKDYVPFVINKHLSRYFDCIMHANQMNMYWMIDNRMQYDYYMRTIRGYKRPFQPWFKKEKMEAIEAIKELYKYSNDKAQEVLALLSDEQIEIIKGKVNKGGIAK